MSYCSWNYRISVLNFYLLWSRIWTENIPNYHSKYKPSFALAVWFRHSDESLPQAADRAYRIAHKSDGGGDGTASCEKGDSPPFRKSGVGVALLRMPASDGRKDGGTDGQADSFFSRSIWLMLSRSHTVWQPCWLTYQDRNFKINCWDLLVSIVRICSCYLSTPRLNLKWEFTYRTGKRREA